MPSHPAGKPDAGSFVCRNNRRMTRLAKGRRSHRTGCGSNGRAAQLAAEDPGYTVAHVGRSKVEIDEWFGVVQSVMADLNRSQSVQHGNVSHHSIEAVAG